MAHTLTAQTIAGRTVRLVAGVQYLASRPFASRGRRFYPVTIEPIGATVPTVHLDTMTYAEADAFVCAFNNGAMSFDGRRW